jgi:hypothetical protein
LSELLSKKTVTLARKPMTAEAGVSIATLVKIHQVPIKISQEGFH